MTILPDLERDLADAAARQGAGASAPHTALGARTAARGGARPNRGAILAITLSSGVALAIAAVILLAGHGHRDGQQTARTGAVPGRQQLIEMLGVLRRPQDHADLHSFFIARLLRRYRQGDDEFGRPGEPDIPLIRRAATTPWGTGIFLIPMSPPPHGEAGVTLAPGAAVPARIEALIRAMRTQTRAALRDPATPNPVTVTPATGPPSTNFSVHFRVLISDADYRFHVTGPPCRYNFQGGQGGGPSDTRGRIYSARLGAIEGQKLCPGTYTVSVSLMDLGAAGNLRRLPGPFGSATFTVRR